jgi:hypothetical protein
MLPTYLASHRLYLVDSVLAANLQEQVYFFGQLMLKISVFS